MTRRLLLLNGLAVLAVAIHHASGFGFQAMFDWTNVYMDVAVPNYDQVGGWQFWGIVLTQQVDNFALPAFMFVSGFFAAFMARGTAPMTWSTVWGRVRTLLIPFAIWTAVFFIFFQRSLPNNINELFDRYYYIVLLCQYYVLSPFLIPLIRKNPVIMLVVAALLEFGRQGIRYWHVFEPDIINTQLLINLSPKWLVPTLFFWFTFGVIVGFNRQKFGETLPKYKWHIFAVWATLIVITIVEYNMVSNVTGKGWLGPYFGGLSRHLYSISFILLFLAFDNITLPFSKQLADLGSKSLGVYLVHARVMFVVAVLMYKFTPALLGIQMVYQLVLIIAGISASLLLMRLVRMSPAKNYYRYLFG